ncbi:MAG: formate dehydrogenase subunit gamma, partial [Burkholderiaceae bacterium]
MSTKPENSPRITEGAAVAAALRDIIQRHAGLPGGLLPALHELQDTLGHVPDALVSDIAQGFNISRAEVHGVISFYPDFRRAPAGNHILEVCRAESCQAKGGDALADQARRRLGCDFGVTGAGDVSLEVVYCLGLCAQSPAIMLDGHPHAHVTPEKLDHLLETAGCRPENQPAPCNRANAAGRQPVTVYVPRDAAALAAGADAVAQAIRHEADARGLAVTLVRNGSRGLLWLEPLLEVVTEQGRVAYGPVTEADVSGLFDAGMLQGGQHRLFLGVTEEIPYLKQQERLTFVRVGITDPLSLGDYAAHRGWQGLRRALAMPAAQIVDEVVNSGLRGRGGAAFPTGIKWQTVLNTTAAQKYIVCNADEGDSGTFADRMLMEGDPYALIEGMVIAGLAVGATQGYIYVRSEYPHAIATLNAAIEHANEAGWLGDDLQGSGRGFHL